MHREHVPLMREKALKLADKLRQHGSNEPIEVEVRLPLGGLVECSASLWKHVAEVQRLSLHTRYVHGRYAHILFQLKWLAQPNENDDNRLFTFSSWLQSCLPHSGRTSCRMLWHVQRSTPSWQQQGLAQTSGHWTSSPAKPLTCSTMSQASSCQTFPTLSRSKCGVTCRFCPTHAHTGANTRRCTSCGGIWQPRSFSSQSLTPSASD